MNITWGGRDGHGDRQDFHDQPSKFQRERDAIADMTEAGIKFDRPAS